MKKITLEDIKTWIDTQLVETQDAGERQEIVDKAKLQAFYLGALDKYARLTKQTQKEFWEEQSQEGYEYKPGRLPEWGNPCADDFNSLEEAYDRGEYTGEEAAERYNEDVLPREFEDAKRELAEAERECDRTRTMECLDNYRMLKERMDSDECGWGANWWED